MMHLPRFSISKIPTRQPGRGTIAGLMALALTWALAGGVAPQTRSEAPALLKSLDPNRALKTVDSNRLAQASSPYLLLHADNPVDWYPWGEEAFEKAREENKPVFLSIGYFTCYWCHVMERESFSDSQVADLLNRFFVSVKVDREQRPGVDALYMRAVQVMGGRGGWPLSTFLTPERKPFFGGTYYPQPQFIDLLGQIRTAWQQQPGRIDDIANEVTRALDGSQGAVGVSEGGKIPPAEPLEAAETAFARSFDAERGGFGQVPKFPQPSILRFLLERYQRTGDEHTLEMLTTTLDAMASGGIRDHLGGGFHRYSTDAQWHVPHFEKMLYDNAQLLWVYATAWQVTGRPEYREVAEEIVGYLDSTLTDPDTGLLYSAQSSLVHKKEGESYVWTPEQVREALGDSQRFEVATRLYNIDGDPDLDGAQVLHRTRSYADIAADFETLDAADIKALHPQIDAALLSARNAREQAPVGTKHILSWNALTIEALTHAGRVMDKPAWVERAAALSDAVMERLYRAEGGPWRAIRGNPPGEVRAQSLDYAALAAAQLALERATGEPRYQRRAAAIANDMIAELWNSERGLFNRRPGNGDLIVETTALHDSVVPAGNSMAAVALTGLAANGYDGFAPYAATVLRAHARILSERPSSLPMMLTALAAYHDTDLPQTAAIPNGQVDTDRSAQSDSSGANLGLELDGVGGGTAASGKGATFSGSKVSMKVSMKVTAAGDDSVDIELAVDAGWHLNANPASLDFLVPTEAALYAGNRKLAVEADYPEPESIPAEALGEGPINVYGGLVRIRLRPTEPIAPDAELSAVADLQACNDAGRCLAPDQLEQTLGSRASLEPQSGEKPAAVQPMVRTQ